MKTASELPAILTIHRMRPGEYMLRVGDLAERPLVVAVSKLLEDAETLVVVTPADIKVLKVSGARGSGARAASDSPSEAAETPRAADHPDELDEEMLQAIKEEEESHAPPNEPQAAEVEVAPNGGEVVGKTAEGMKVVRRRKSPAASAGHDEPCSRCRGTGQIKIIQEGGVPGETMCAVCQGAGVLRRYGSRR